MKSRYDFHKGVMDEEGKLRQMPSFYSFITDKKIEKRNTYDSYG